MDEQTVTARHTRPVTFILHDCTPFRHGLGKFRKSPMGTHFPKAGIRVVAPRVEMDSGFWGNDVEARFAFVGMWAKALDDVPLLRHSLRAIGYADVRYGILPTRAGLRRNDGEGNRARG